MRSWFLSSVVGGDGGVLFLESLKSFAAIAFEYGM